MPTARSFCIVAFLQCPFCILLCFDTVQSCRWIQQSQFFISHCCCCSFRSSWMFCCCNWEIVTELNAWPWQWRHFNASEYQLAAGTAWLTNKIHFGYLIVSQIGCRWKMWNGVEYTPFMRSKRLELRVFPLQNNQIKVSSLNFFLSNAPQVLYGLHGLPSWAWQKCNWLLSLGRPWGAVTLSQWYEWWYRRM